MRRYHHSLSTSCPILWRSRFHLPWCAQVCRARVTRKTFKVRCTGKACPPLVRAGLGIPRSAPSGKRRVDCAGGLPDTVPQTRYPQLNSTPGGVQIRPIKYSVKARTEVPIPGSRRVPSAGVFWTARQPANEVTSHRTPSPTDQPADHV
jgi:hypothetical protein